MRVICYKMLKSFNNFDFDFDFDLNTFIILTLILIIVLIKTVRSIELKMTENIV